MPGPYTPDPDDFAAPLDTDWASIGAAEFRALKEKLTNFFSTSGINATDNTYYIEHGAYFINTNASASPVRAIVAAAERSGGNGAVIGADITGGLADGVSASVNDIVAGALVTGIVNVGASAGLDGLEAIRAQAIQRDHNGQVYVKGLAIKFLNRGELETAAPGGLGSNGYNSNSVGIFITSQAPSTSGENCGWGRGIMFNSFSLDDDIGASLPRPIAIDFTPAMGNFNSAKRPLPFHCTGNMLENGTALDQATGTYTIDPTKLAGVIRIVFDDAAIYGIPIVAIAAD